MTNELKPFLLLFRRHWRWMALGVLCGVIAVAAAAALLALAGWFISAAAFAGLATASAYQFNFFFPSIGVRIFALLRTLARYAERVVSHDATFRILESLRSWFYARLEPLAPGRLGPYRSGDILNRIVADIDALDNLYLKVLSPSIVASVLSVLLLLFLWRFDPFMALTTATVLALAGFGLPAVAAKLGSNAGRRLARCDRDLRTGLVEAIQGLPELLVFGAYHHHLANIRGCHEALVRQQRFMRHIQGSASAALICLTGLAVLVVLYLGGGLVHHRELDGANLALLALAVLAAFEAIWPLPAAYQYLGRTREAGRRLLEIVNTAPAAIFAEQSEVRPLRFDVTFEHITFRYRSDAPPALSNVSLAVSQGQRVAILGQTGAGKSTLAHLLVRFYDPEDGRILIGERDVRQLSESDLRRHIAVVSQQAHMFNASIRENLRLAKPEASEAELTQALAAVHLLEFVHSLPDGLNTWIGESGKLLSAGQARRLALARAVLRNAPIWLLDEPTEGLDRITERDVMHALHELSTSRTVLLITHRLTDLDHMDDIYVLEKGRIVEHGTHAALMAGSTRYAAWQTQIA
jgi:ATP-binding cassette, subfamily C, bacterial CydC